MALTLTWLGHSTFLLDTDDVSLIIDPFITNNPLCEMSVDEIDVQYILLTHAHGDHVGDNADGTAGDTIAIAQRTGATVACNFEMGNWFSAHGVENLWQGNPGGTLSTDSFDMKLTKAFHSSSFGDGTYGGQPTGMIIRAEGHTIYHAGDTSLFGDMALIGEEGIDVALLPIGDRFTMGIADSIRATKLIKPRQVLPVHYNTFPPIVQDATEWAEHINRDTDAQPIVIDPGMQHTIE